MKYILAVCLKFLQNAQRRELFVILLSHLVILSIKRYCMVWWLQYNEERNEQA